MQALDHVSRLSLLLLSFTMSAAAAAAPYAEYRVTVMGPANSTAVDINKAGVVVGIYPSRAGQRGFLNRGKGLVDLGALGGRASEAVAINDKGEVLGHWTTRAGQQRGFIHYAGKQRDIGVIPGRHTRYTDINNHGYATAIGDALSIDGSRSFLRDPKGRFTDIGNLRFDEPTLNHALALNNRNQVTGESGPLVFPDQPLRAFVWSRGVMRDLGDLGFTPNGGLAINDRGQITGYMSLPTGFRNRVAFLYHNGRLVNIDGRPDTVERSSTGLGINNHGHIVGASDHLSGFIYRGRRMQSLNALIDPKLGWDIWRPAAINDAGQIAATAYRRGVQYAVRLDLIRPSMLSAPLLETDDEDAALAGQAAPAAAEAEAQEREVVQPVPQE
ncbi:HAF repeat-containing protein [Massilia consociata]|uniref:HAF repeat-containing protein n=1 Tax=Massilia consociata TaxID=760117 RepID=A0ABV6FJ00_9BURK